MSYKVRSMATDHAGIQDIFGYDGGLFLLLTGNKPLEA